MQTLSVYNVQCSQMTNIKRIKNSKERFNVIIIAQSPTLATKFN